MLELQNKLPLNSTSRFLALLLPEEEHCVMLQFHTETFPCCGVHALRQMSILLMWSRARFNARMPKLDHYWPFDPFYLFFIPYDLHHQIFSPLASVLPPIYRCLCWKKCVCQNFPDIPMFVLLYFKLLPEEECRAERGREWKNKREIDNGYACEDNFKYLDSEVKETSSRFCPTQILPLCILAFIPLWIL